MQNLREKRGYTYGVVAAMVNFEQAGYFAVATQVGTDVTRDALRKSTLKSNSCARNRCPTKSFCWSRTS